MKKIVYTKPDGSVAVVHPAPNSRRPGESEEAFLSRVILRAVPKDAINVMSVDSIPADRSFRNAWQQSGRGVSVNMSKARNIHRDNLRELRKPKLEQLDVEWMKCMASGDKSGADSVESKRQALRDATKHAAIDAAATPEELKAAIPNDLK